MKTIKSVNPVSMRFYRLAVWLFLILSGIATVGANSCLGRTLPPTVTRVMIPPAQIDDRELQWQKNLIPGLLNGILGEMPFYLAVDGSSVNVKAIWQAKDRGKEILPIVEKEKTRYLVLTRIKKGSVEVILADIPNSAIEIFTVKTKDPADFASLKGVLMGLHDRGMALPGKKRIEESLENCKYASPKTARLYLSALQMESTTPAGKVLLKAREAMEQNPGFLPARDLYGRILGRTGNFNKASAFYRRFVESGPYSLQSYLDYGLLMASKGRYTGAALLFNRGLLVYPKNITLLYNLAYVLEKADKTDGAQRAYLLILEMDPKNDAARYNLGALYYSRGYYGHALPLFEALEEDNPGNPYYAYQSASALLGMGRIDEAEKKLTDLSKRGAYKEVYNDLGLLFRARGNYTEAVRYFRMASAMDPAYGAPLNNGAVAHILAGNSDEARRWLERALRINPSYPEALYNLGLLEMQKENYDRAWLYFYRVSQVAPRFYQARINMAICRIHSGKPEEALKMLEELQKDYGTDRLVLYNLGVVYRMTGQSAKALACFEKLLSIYPASAEAIVNASAIFINSRQFEKAIPLLDHGLGIFPSDFALNFNRGLGAYHTGDYRKASVFLQKALEINNGDRRVRRFLIRALLMEGRFADAKVHIDKALSEDPADHMSIYLLAVYQQRINQPEKAAETMKQMLASMDYNFDGYLNLARLYMWMKKYDEAASVFEKIIKMEPQSGESYLNLGTALVMEKRYDKATAALEEARRLMPSDSRPLHHLGVMHIEKREFGKAGELYRKALSIEPLNEFYLSNLALCLAYEKSFEEACRLVTDGVEMHPQSPRMKYMAAVIFALSGNKAHMLKYLKLATDAEPTLKVRAREDEDLKNFRQDRDFLKIINTTGEKK